MHPYPHTYLVEASARATGEVTLSSAGLPDIAAAAPAQFDGPGDRWSPETLLCAAVANCFILTFRSMARASKLEWTALECRTEATLENVEGVAQFTSFVTHGKLRIAAGVDAARAQALLQKAEDRCLIANSLKGSRHLDAVIEQAA